MRPLVCTCMKEDHPPLRGRRRDHRPIFAPPVPSQIDGCERCFHNVADLPTMAADFRSHRALVRYRRVHSFQSFSSISHTVGRRGFSPLCARHCLLGYEAIKRGIQRRGGAYMPMDSASIARFHIRIRIPICCAHGFVGEPKFAGHGKEQGLAQNVERKRIDGGLRSLTIVCLFALSTSRRESWAPST